MNWFPAPIKTEWGHEMVVANLEIDKDHTLTLYCEREQIPKVEAMFAPQRQWVGLTDEEIKSLPSWWPSYNDQRVLLVLIRDIQTKLKEKNT